MWQQEADVPFPLLLDQDHEVYKTYGLERSLLGNLSPATVWFYFKKMLRGELPRFDRGRIDQMGGDFLIDADGVLRYRYRSHSPTDRPSIDRLLAEVRQLSDSQKEA